MRSTNYNGPYTYRMSRMERFRFRIGAAAWSILAAAYLALGLLFLASV